MSGTYSEFREDMLCALYQEQMHEGVDDLISFRDLVDDYEIEWREGWLLDLQKSLISEGFLRGPANSMNDDMAIGRLLGRGLQYIEDKHGTLDGVPTMILKKGHEDQLVVQEEELPSSISEITGGRMFVSQGPLPQGFEGREGDLHFEIEPDQSATDSSGWTGLPKRGVLSRDASERLQAALKVADQALHASSATNEERAWARAYIIAIQALADTPEPPADLIWQLIQRANSIAGIASFFVALMALFAHA